MASSKSKRTDPLPAALEACLQRHVGATQRLVVGLSGGLDSVALLHCLRAAVPRNQVSALHVHHGLSPHADAWAAFCRDLCGAWNVPISLSYVAVERGSHDGLEAAARRERHRVFDRAKGDWLVLAHHRDDQAETILFNLLRGTGLRGAAAMREASGRLLRPFLAIARSEIEAYATTHALTWVDDESNADTAFSRNYLRHDVLADINRRFPGASANLAAASGRFAEAQSLLDELALQDLGDPAAEFPIPLAVLISLSEPRARNVLRYLLQQKRIGIPSDARLREALRQLVHAANDRHPAIVFGGHRLLRRGGWVCVESA